MSTPASAFADGVEFEETFPDATPPAAPAPEAPPADATRPRLSVVPDEAQPAAEPVRHDPLERRLREAEAMVTDTVERMRLAEERRLEEWIRERRGEEERRLAAWVEERRASVERALEQRSAREDELARRIEELLVEWQARFEQRLEQRRVEDEREHERRRLVDEERLRSWRRELEQALGARFAERRDRGVAPDRRDESGSPTRDLLRAADSVRDVGRVLRDAVAEIARTSAVALAVHHRDEVPYRYRVAAEDELGALLRREALDDGPQSAAAHANGWSRAQRAVHVGARNVIVHTAQCAIRSAGGTVAVLTLQSDGEAIPDASLARIDDLLLFVAPRLVELRDAGRLRGA